MNHFQRQKAQIRNNGILAVIIRMNSPENWDRTKHNQKKHQLNDIVLYLQIDALSNHHQRGTR